MRRGERSAWIVIAAAVATLLLAGSGLRAFAATSTVSQRNRQFDPRTVELRVGDMLRIINDDGELLHHAYVKSDTFSFDSGEQKPGQAVEIRFPAGHFVVLCGIHPKMRLDVTVK